MDAPTRTTKAATTRRFQQIQRALLRSSTSSTVLPEPVQTKYQPVLLNQETPEDDAPYPLTEEETFSFLENVLEMNKPQEVLDRDRQAFLDTFILLMNAKIPFTNFNMFRGKDMVSISCPTLQDCKEAIFKRYGGNCLYINIFTKALLDVLGFKTFHIGANNPGDASYDTHVSTILCDLTYPGSQHLVDPGTIRPLYKAIPLDFEKESPIYQFHYMKVKFFKRDHGILLSCSQVPEPETPRPNIFENKGCFWKIEMIYRLHAPRSRAYWLKTLKYGYHFPSLSPHIFNSVGLFGQNGDKFVSLGHNGDIFGLRYQYLDPSQAEIMLLSRDEFLDVLHKEFAQYPREMIENALDNVRYVQNMYKY